MAGLKKRGKSFLLALIVIFIAHLSLVFSDWAFKTDFRLWVFAIKPLDLFHFDITLGYLIPFVIYFMIMGMVLHGQMRPGKPGTALGMGKEMGINILLLVLSYIIFILLHYIPRLSGGTLGFGADMALGGIFMFQFVPIFIIVALISTYFYRKTGHIFVGAYINTMLVVWIIVAGQAVHYPY